MEKRISEEQFKQVVLIEAGLVEQEKLHKEGVISERELQEITRAYRRLKARAATLKPGVVRDRIANLIAKTKTPDQANAANIAKITSYLKGIKKDLLQFRNDYEEDAKILKIDKSPTMQTVFKNIDDAQKEINQLQALATPEIDDDRAAGVSLDKITKSDLDDMSALLGTTGEEPEAPADAPPEEKPAADAAPEEKPATDAAPEEKPATAPTTRAPVPVFTTGPGQSGGSALDRLRGAGLGKGPESKAMGNLLRALKKDLEAGGFRALEEAVAQRISMDNVISAMAEIQGGSKKEAMKKELKALLDQYKVKYARKFEKLLQPIMYPKEGDAFEYTTKGGKKIAVRIHSGEGPEGTMILHKIDPKTGKKTKGQWGEFPDTILKKMGKKLSKISKKTGKKDELGTPPPLKGKSKSGTKPAGPTVQTPLGPRTIPGTMNEKKAKGQKKKLIIHSKQKKQNKRQK